MLEIKDDLQKSHDSFLNYHVFAGSLLRLQISSYKMEEDIIHIENLAIFSLKGQIAVREVRNYVIDHWPAMTKGMDNSTMLFMAGVHGSDEGKFGPKANSYENMKTQMNKIFPRDHPHLQADKERRHIKFEFMDVGKFLDQKTGQDIRSEEFLAELRRINAQMIIIVICFSQILDFKRFLESSGLLSGIKLNMELRIQSNGQILTLNKIQRKFIQTVAQNIEKKIVHIEGKVGSGKTLLGIETVKMKLNHYFRKYHLSINDLAKKLKVILLADDMHAKLLMDQLRTQLSQDVDHLCELQYGESKAITKGVLKSLVLTRNHPDFKHTIVMIDECFLDNFENYFWEIDNIDFIHCVRYNQIGQRFNEVMEDVYIFESTIFCQLFQCQRSSQEILNLADYIHKHSAFSFPMKKIQLENSFQGKPPEWIDISSTKEFIKYAHQNLQNAPDVMVIHEERNKKLEDFCQVMLWKYCYLGEVTGFEASTVIIYDLEKFHYEVFTRAKHELIIVTHSRKTSDLKKTLKEIENGNHNYEHCGDYKKRYLKKIGATKGQPAAPSLFASLGADRKHFCNYKYKDKEKISFLLTKVYLDNPGRSSTVTDGRPSSYTMSSLLSPLGRPRGGSDRPRPISLHQYLENQDEVDTAKRRHESGSMELLKGSSTSLLKNYERTFSSPSDI